MSPVHLSLFLLFHVIWALAVMFAKIGMEEMPPMVFSGVRFMLVAACTLPFLAWFKGKMWQIFAVAMTAGGLNFALFFTGLHLAEDVSTLAIVGQLGVPFAVLMSIAFLGEQVGWRRWLGVSLSFGGVMIISFDPRVLTYYIAVLFGVAGALVGASSMIFQRTLKDVGVFQLQAWVSMFSWPVLLLSSLVFETGQVDALTTASWRAWGALVFTGLVSSLIAHAGMYWLIQRYEVSRLAPLGLIQPVIMIGFGVAFLGDTVTTRMLLGGVVTLMGVLIITIRQPETHGVRAGDGPLPNEAVRLKGDEAKLAAADRNLTQPGVNEDKPSSVTKL